MNQNVTSKREGSSKSKENWRRNPKQRATTGLFALKRWGERKTVKRSPPRMGARVGTGGRYKTEYRFN